MGIKAYKPTSPGRRWQTVFTFEELTTDKPEKSLTKGKKRISGRNCYGRITLRRRGGGHKRKLRFIDFKREKLHIKGRVASIEYDPNRSARIALINYIDGEKRYIVAPLGLNKGDWIISDPEADIRPGNTLPLGNIPIGTIVHNVEMKPGKGAQIARSAGTSCQIMAKEGKYAHLKLPSGEVRLFDIRCKATIGQVGNVEHENISLGKAGRSRWLGRRPKVRGVAMNPHDHPMGGGEGKTSGGRHPCSPWGLKSKGKKTRKKKKESDKYIIKRRS